MTPKDFRRTATVLALSSLTAVVACDPGVNPTSISDIPDRTEVPSTTSSAQPVSRIIVFRGGQPDVAGLARGLAAGYGSVPEHIFTQVIEGFSARLPEAAAEALAQNPLVEYVEVDGVVSLNESGSQSNPTWGLDRIDQRPLPLNMTYGYGTDGSGVHAYILDTGIRTTHQEFGNRATFDMDYTGGPLPNNGDCHGHGTHVAGTVGGAAYGVAKNVWLHGVRVLDCQGSGSYSGIIAALDWVAIQQNTNSDRPTVVNMSLGGGQSTSVNDAVNGAVSDGVVVVVAAGNESTDACTRSPASAVDALTVGSTTSSDSRSSFSNYGTCLDVFAPGSSITSSTQDSDTSTGTWSGTSMATPHVAGVAALYLASDPGLTPAEVMTALLANATTGVISDAGSGSPDRLLFSEVGEVPSPPPPTLPTQVHVDELDVTVSFSRRNANGTALVSVIDAGGSPVVGANVTGDWSANDVPKKSGTSGVTDANGVASITSGGMKNVRSGDLIEFCVTGISGDNLSYEVADPDCALAGSGGGGNPPAGAFTLSASVRKKNEVRLSWSGAGSPTFEVKRYGAVPSTTSTDDWSFTESPPEPGTWTYEVCDMNAQCTNEVMVTTR